MYLGSLCSAGAVRYLMVSVTYAGIRKHLCSTLMTTSEMIPGVTCLKAKIRRSLQIDLVTPEPIHTSGFSWARIHPKMFVGSLYSAGAVRYLMVSATYTGIRKHPRLSLMTISEMIHIDSTYQHQNPKRLMRFHGSSSTLLYQQFSIGPHISEDIFGLVKFH